MSVTSDSGMTSLDLNTIPGSSPAVTTPSVIAASSSVIDSRAALKHVLNNMLCLPTNSGLRQSLNAAGYYKLSMVLAMPVPFMKMLTHKTKVAGAAVDVGLLPSEEVLLLALQGFARFKEHQMGHTLSPKDWILFSEEDFDEYLSSYHTSPLPSNPAPTTPVNIPIDLLKRDSTWEFDRNLYVKSLAIYVLL